MAKVAKKTKKAMPEVAAPYDDKKWQAEDDVRTLTKSIEIRADKQRLARAMDHARTKMAEFKDIAAGKKI